MIAKIPYSIEKDFQPVALVARGHLLLAVTPTSTYKSVQDLIAAAKKEPGKMTNASSASGSPGHVGAELFNSWPGSKPFTCPIAAGQPATTDLIAGRVTFMFESLNSISAHAKSGAVRALDGQRRPPLTGICRRADGRGGRRAGLQRADLERRHRASGHAARR